jgi:hypothetical protein
MFPGKAMAYMKGASLKCGLLALTTNMELGWKGFGRNKDSSLPCTFINYGNKRF